MKLPSRSAEAGQTLIGLLVAIVIVAILAGIFYPKLTGRHEYSPSGQVQGAATPIDDAYDTQCTVYMQEVAAAAGEYRQDHNAPPPSLEALKPYGVTQSMIDTPDCNFGIPKTAPAAPQPAVAGALTGPGLPGYQPGAPGTNTAAPAPPQSTTPAQPGTRTLIGPGINVRVPTSVSEGGADLSQ